MSSLRAFVIIFTLISFSLMGLSGCTSIMSFLRGIETYFASSMDDDKDFDSELFRETRGNEGRKGGKVSQAKGYGWVPPVVQKVKVPAMIRGGVFIPSHETYVIVTDGAFVTDDVKLEGVRKKYRLPAEAEIVSPLKGDDVVMAVYRLGKVFNQSKVVELTKISFMLDGKPIDHILSLHNDEIANIGGYLCSFSREKGDDQVVAYISEGDGLKQIRLFQIGKGQMIVLGNGYVLAPVFDRKKGGVS